MRRLIFILLLIGLGYFAGAKFPVIANKLGVA